MGVGALDGRRVRGLGIAELHSAAQRNRGEIFLPPRRKRLKQGLVGRRIHFAQSVLRQYLGETRDPTRVEAVVSIVGMLRKLILQFPLCRIGPNVQRPLPPFLAAAGLRAIALRNSECRRTRWGRSRSECSPSANLRKKTSAAGFSLLDLVSPGRRLLAPLYLRFDLVLDPIISSDAVLRHATCHAHSMIQ